MKSLLWCLMASSLWLSGCYDPLSYINDVQQNDIDKSNIDKKENTMKNNVIIGNLGGVPVELPTEVVHLVEYNGDPSWGEARQGEIPQRTYQSKLNSFGFDVRYTDGVLYDGFVGKYADEYEAQKNLSDSPWVSVGINSGDRYYGSGGIDRIGQGTINAEPNRYPTSIYAKLPDTQFGLEVYASPGINPKTNTPWREDEYAEDVFIKRDENGKIITYIQCSNKDVPHPPCTHYFDLEPDMKLDVYVSYSRYVLQDWQRIEEVVKNTLLGFRK